MSNKTSHKQQGIVSIVVTLILMMVLTLIVLSFAKISRREQRTALDRQLSTQAFYAAESGVNDVINILKDWPDNEPGWGMNFMTDCTGANSFDDYVSSTIDTPSTIAGLNTVAYTCVFVDPTPAKIKFAKSDDTHVFPLEALGGGTLNELVVDWDDESILGPLVGGCLQNAAVFPTPADYPAAWSVVCPGGLLRIEFVDASDLSVSRVFYLIPSFEGNGGLSFAGSPSGSIMYGNCDTNRRPKCQARIGLNATKYFVRVKSLYIPSQIDFTAHVAGLPVETKGAQAIIDVTGRAEDVLRRIQVRIKANDIRNVFPGFALEGTEKICKKFSLNGGIPGDDGNCTDTSPFPD